MRSGLYSLMCFGAVLLACEAPNGARSSLPGDMGTPDGAPIGSGPSGGGEGGQDGLPSPGGQDGLPSPGGQGGLPSPGGDGGQAAPGGGVAPEPGPCASRAADPSGNCPATIYEARREIGVGVAVVVQGVVTALKKNAAGEVRNLVIQIGPDQAEYFGPDDSAVWVFLGDGTVPPEALSMLSTTSSIRLAGTTNDFFGQRQLNVVTEVTILGAVAPIVPLPVVAVDVSTEGRRAARLEGVLLSLYDVVVTDVMPPPGEGDRVPTSEFAVTGGLLIDDFFFVIEPTPALGSTFARLDGVLRLGNANMKLEPRDALDVESGAGPSPGPARLSEFGPSDTRLELRTSALPRDAQGTALHLALDRPAPAGGLDISLASDLPAQAAIDAQIHIDAGQSTADVTVTSGELEGPVGLTASLNGLTLRVAVHIGPALPPAPPPGAALVLSEIDYDQDGSDLLEFIELYNPTGAPLPLADQRLELINGSDGMPYGSYALFDAGPSLAAGGLLVIGSEAVLQALPAGVLRLPLMGSIQNGAPDGVRIVDAFGALIDGLAYEGPLPGTGEGEPAAGDPGQPVHESIARCLNLADTQDNAADFRVLAATPGLAQTCD